MEPPVPIPTKKRRGERQVHWNSIEDAYDESPPPPALLDVPIVAKRCGQSSAKVLDHVFPQPLWKPFGETRGRLKKTRWRKKKRGGGSGGLLGASWVHSWGLLGAAWAALPLGGFLGPPGVWRLLGKLFGYHRAFLASLTPSEADLGPSLGVLGALLGRFGAVFEAILGVLEASRAVLGGPLGVVLGASWAVMWPSWRPLGCSGVDLGGLLGRLGPSEGLQRAKATILQTHKESS